MVLSFKLGANAILILQNVGFEDATQNSEQQMLDFAIIGLNSFVFEFWYEYKNL